MHSRLAILFASALTLAVVQSASAADLPRKAPVMAPAVVAAYNWTGCHIGGHVGGLWAKKDWTLLTAGPFFGAPLGGHDADGWLAGGQAGCDYQFANRFVIGFQGSYSWVDADGSHIDLVDPTLTDRTRIDWLATVTGRLGYSWDRFLGYVRGGVAWERDEYDAFITLTGAPFDAGSETRFGWTVGVGGEYAFSPYVSVFAEYNYYDFGTRDVGLFSPGGVLTDLVDIEERKHVVKVGVNFRFGWGGPLP
jgi:outer membrane immunogenic protein